MMGLEDCPGVKFSNVCICIKKPKDSKYYVYYSTIIGTFKLWASHSCIRFLWENRLHIYWQKKQAAGETEEADGGGSSSSNPIMLVMAVVVYNTFNFFHLLGIKPDGPTVSGSEAYV